MEFTEKDRELFKKLGIKEEQILWQIEMFKKGTPYLKLLRPCKIGDGIIKIEEEEARYLARFYEENSRGLKKVKFVPASGAATRMFKAEMKFFEIADDIDRIRNLAEKDQDARDFLVFVEKLKEFAFYDELKSVMEKDGYDIERFIKEKRFKKILEYILTEKGLNYGRLPKAFIKFHRYPDETRTAFEEHLVEAVFYVKEDGLCLVHFTVSPGHEERFKEFSEKIRGKYEKRFSVRYRIDFSVQKRSTDTIAVDMNNNPVRMEDGSLLFRPGGHGALIYNLNSIDADLIFIKNIDNVLPDRIKPVVSFWKKVLAGYLLKIKEKIDGFLKRLEKGEDDLVNEAIDFCRRFLNVNISERDPETVRRFLDRPLRVCGMVRNVGEPGGGPFWVEDKKGRVSVQIVESAQVDMSSEEQKNIFFSATHFNPVDIVCSVKDWKGRKYDLMKYVDKDAVFITVKSTDGKEIKALEYPGLWNGGMAYWNTVFVEVPEITFSPVKKVIDLLKEGHRV